MLAQIEDSKLILSYQRVKQECDVEKKGESRDRVAPHHQIPDIKSHIVYNSVCYSRFLLNHMNLLEMFIE